MSSLTSLSYAEIVFATVPDAAPTIRNHRATSCPAPISANDPNFDVSRLIDSAFWCVPTLSSPAIGKLYLATQHESTRRKPIPGFDDFSLGPDAVYRVRRSSV